MELADYLDALHNGQRVLPNTIEMPERLSAEFFRLAFNTEALAAEHGCYLLYDPGARQVALGDEARGPAKSFMTIPRSDDPMNFGDFHAHPSASVGVAGGYSPHSPADLSHFGDFPGRGYFIQFVAAGPMLYAMIFVDRVSTWNEEVRRFVDAAGRDQARVNRGPLYHEAEMRALQAGEVKPAEAQADWAFAAGMVKAADEGDDDGSLYTDDLMRQVPGYGKSVAERSVLFCEQFAEAWGYKFLKGQWNTANYVLK